jgi:ABC-type cobalamin/Fe3+-siderophores transport system ATPase subunit
LANERRIITTVRIKKIRLQRFRQFADTTFEVGPFNLLVGPNNCGKTTLLHAIRAFFVLMHGHVRFEGKTAEYHRRFLADAGEIAPTPDIKELWYEQQAGKPLTISLTFDDDKTFAVVMRQQFGQIHVSAEDLPEKLTLSEAKTHLGTQVAFIPGLVGVLVTEPFVTGARRNALAIQGRYSEIFRSSLFQLKESSPDLVAKINEWLTGLFSVKVSTVEFDPKSDEFVTIKYAQNGTDFDVVSSGAGLQQVIQMLTYLYLSKPGILLIDEPDAHLHSKLQAQLGQLFRRVSDDLGAQVFLSTHSLDLIDTFSTNEVLVIDSTKKVVQPIGANNDLISVLVDANVVDVSALSRLLSSRQLVVVEDKDQTILKAIDKSVGSQLYSSKSNTYVLAAKGIGNFRAVAELGRVLRGLTGTKFDLTFLQDRDGMPDFIVKDFLASQQGDGVFPRLLERHEIESYVIEPGLIESAAKKIGRLVTVDDCEKAIFDAAKNLKAEARRKCLETARLINRHLLAPKRLEEQDLERKVYEWFDGLNLTSLQVLQNVFPGKELLKETLKILNGNKGKQITRGQVVATISGELISGELSELLKSLAAVNN